MNFKGKIIIITGASSGIGLASARLFASKGAKLILAARSQNKLDAIAGELSCQTDVLCLKTDVSIEADCRNLVEKGVERFGGIDILINNAGLSMRAMFKDLDLSVIK
ncbi:MAG: SDR family NAD(P)-dependent oxidoreductase, partial [Bacteroidales bacterium]